MPCDWQTVMEADANPACLSGLRTILAANGIQPNRKLGQNFLIDGNILDIIRDYGALQAGEDVVEIGPGLGALTRVLLQAGCRVHAIEFDRALFGYLSDQLQPHYSENLHLIHADAVDHPLAGFTEGASRPFKIIANLPYAISTPWLENMLRGPLPQKMVLMLQKEAADRFTAGPGSRHFGAISIFLQSAYQQCGSHRVSPRCFYPVPDVHSTLIVCQLREDAYAFSAPVRQLIRQVFTFRRKQARSVFQRLGQAELYHMWESHCLGPNQIPATVRAEAIPLDHWQQLDTLAARVPHPKPNPA